MLKYINTIYFSHINIFKQVLLTYNYFHFNLCVKINKTLVVLTSDIPFNNLIDLQKTTKVKDTINKPQENFLRLV